MYGVNEEGLSLDTVMQYAQREGIKIGQIELRNLVEGLSAEGILYTTIDDLHHATTE
jgi:hypothetical protein